MKLIRWLNPAVYWRRLQRKVDRVILIEEIKKASKGDKKKIAQALALHISIDRAWQVESWELTGVEAELLIGMMFWLSKEDEK